MEPIQDTPAVNTPVAEETPELEAPASVETAPQPVQAGDKTPSALLLESLHEERERRRIAEAEAAEAKRQLEEQSIHSTTPSEDDDFSDEGRALRSEITEVRSELAALREERELESVYAKFPDLKEMSEEFNTFRADYPRTKLENVAKLFRTEKGIMETTRIGLEKPTGGDRTPIASGMTAEEVADLRKNNWRKYQDMLAKGQIKLG